MTSTHFDEIAHQYEASLAPHVIEHYLRKRVSFIASHCPRGIALDVGCGTGLLASRLAAVGYNVIGVDPSPGMIGILKSRPQDIGSLIADGSALPFAQGTFDLVYCVAVLHHVAEPERVRRVLAEMVRVAKPGGRVLVWDHNPSNLYWPVIMRRVPQDTGEERLVPQDEIVVALQSAGARTAEVRKLGFVPDFVPRSLVGFAARLERAAEAIPLLRRLSAHNVVLAEKAAPKA